MKKENVIVSACLLGRNCKYNGGNNYSEAVLKYLEGKKIIAVCPEMAGGLPVPRPPVELVDGAAVDKNGRNVDSYFQKGVDTVLAQIEGELIAAAVLQPRSPSCGAKQIYDGSFTGKLIPGEGMLAAALRRRGILVIDAAEISLCEEKEPTKEEGNGNVSSLIS